jgi:hypothetical protein
MSMAEKSRELRVGEDCCPICGQPITSKERFYRDDPSAREPWTDRSGGCLPNRWSHIACVEGQLKRKPGST